MSFSGNVDYTPTTSSDVLFHGRRRRTNLYIIETNIFLIPKPIYTQILNQKQFLFWFDFYAVKEINCCFLYLYSSAQAAPVKRKKASLEADGAFSTLPIFSLTIRYNIFKNMLKFVIAY